MYLLNAKQMSRRTLLRAGAITLGLPLLDAMLPLGARAEEKSALLHPQRLLLIGRLLGTNDEYFFPKTPGLQYEPTRYLKIIERHRGKFTVFSGMSHLDYPNLHNSEVGLFTGAEPWRIERGDDIRNTVSLDQFAARHLANETRFPCLVIGRRSASLSYNEGGMPIPGYLNPDEVFRRLFLNGSSAEMAGEIRRLQEGRSILDRLRDELALLQRTLGPADRNRIELLGTSIRDAERQLLRDEAWASKPKPNVDRKVEDYLNSNWTTKQKMFYDLVHLAFETDSTRIVAVQQETGQVGDVPGITLEHHDASHHGQDPTKIEQFALYEEEETRNIGLLLDKLSGSNAGGRQLLDETILLWASNIGNPSAHASSNLPILLGGGGFRHQGHLAFNRERNYPLSNLYVRMLHQMQIDADKFGSSTGELSEV